MKKTVRMLQAKRQQIAYYISGFFVLGFGVNVMKASDLGAGAWDTVTINVRAYVNLIIGWQWVTLGMVSFLVSLIIMSIVLGYRKQIRYVFMLVPIFLVALAIDFWNIVVFQDRILDQMVWQVLFYGSGIFILPLGLTLIIKSSFPAFVFDELMMMLVHITKAKTITPVRLGIELLGISIGAVFGYLTFYSVDGSLGAVNIGSFVFTIVFSPIMAMWFRVWKVKHS